MSIKKIGMGFLVIAFVLASGSAVLHAKEQKLSREMVPAEVLNAFEKSYPKAVIRGYEEEIEHGKTFYEIESKDGEMHRDILYSPAGEIAEIEETIPKSDIPQLVQRAITSQFPKAEIRRAEKISREGKTYYEVGFQEGGKRFSREYDGQGAPAKE